MVTLSTSAARCVPPSPLHTLLRSTALGVFARGFSLQGWTDWRTRRQWVRWAGHVRLTGEGVREGRVQPMLARTVASNVRNYVIDVLGGRK